MHQKEKITVTAAVICQKEKILITRRPEGVHLGGMWEFPGGKKESSETLEQCMERELFEELGINVRVEKKLIQVRHEYRSKIVELHFFKCAILKGCAEPREGQEMEWVEPGMLKDYTFPPPDKKIVACITEHPEDF